MPLAYGDDHARTLGKRFGVVREAIEDRRWADANRYAKLTADALNAYSDRLDKATALLKGA